ncbi:MAG TPA: acetyl-CoA carboxylase biotin carboxyl carrier protein subunit [Ktedonobacterales bacterium]
MARERAQRNGGEAAPAPAPTPASAETQHEIPGLSIAEIRQLITLMHNSDLAEIVIEHGENLKLVLRNPAPDAMASAGFASQEVEFEALDGTQGDEAAGQGTASSTTIEIGAPLVGVYRARVKAGEKPLVKPGDVVREGQVVAAVEALNYINEIESSAAGRVTEIFVRDGQPVEYGQPLLAIEPK